MAGNADHRWLGFSRRHSVPEYLAAFAASGQMSQELLPLRLAKLPFKKRGQQVRRGMLPPARISQALQDDFWQLRHP